MAEPTGIEPAHEHAWTTVCGGVSVNSRCACGATKSSHLRFVPGDPLKRIEMFTSSTDPKHV